MTQHLAVPAYDHDADPATTGSGAEWEWRAFDQADRWPASLCEGVPTRVSALRVETYVLTRASPHTVRLWRDRVEVDRLVEQSPVGVDCWESVLDETYPIGAAALRCLGDALQVVPCSGGGTLSGPELLLAFLTRSCPGVRIAPIRAWAAQCTIDECEVERATVLIGVTLHDTLRLRHPRCDALLATLQRFGLDPGQNVSMVSMLKRHVGLGG